MRSLFFSIRRRTSKYAKGIANEVKLKSIKKIEIPVVIRNVTDRSKPRKKYTDRPFEGAHIFVNQKRHGVKYQHHGIYIGDGRVIHFSDDKGIYETSLERFCRNGHKKLYGIIHSKRKGSHSRVVERAKRVIKKQDFRYNLISENCEHFANYCRSGKRSFLYAVRLEHESLIKLL